MSSIPPNAITLRDCTATAGPVCHVTSDSYAAALGYQPPSSGALFGWVEKHAGGQHESAPRADDELVHVGDEIDEGVVVIVNPCLSWSAPLLTRSLAPFSLIYLCFVFN